MTEKPRFWFQYMTRYHWLVFVVATCGWLFDCMDQRLFILARQPALRQLMPEGTAREIIDFYGGIATSSMVIGWATGGLIFGILSDRIGRVKTLVITLFFYAGFTGLSALSISWWDLVLYRFLVGLGVGGQFAAAATLVAESMPEQARAQALGTLQALSAVGNITGSAISIAIPPDLLFMGSIPGWRVLFMIGVLPALLAIFMIRHLKEPERWREARDAAARGETRSMGSIKDLFGERRWRRNTLVGVTLAVVGVVGLWGIGFFSPELVQEALQDEPVERVTFVKSFGTMLQDVGAFFGMYAFMIMALFLGRRQAFFCALILGMVVVAYVFTSLETATDAYWMLPLLGFSTLAIFGGYSIYFPELYPTRLRNTGVGFNYNVGRYLAVPFPMLMTGVGALFTTAFREGGSIANFYAMFGLDSGFRAAAFTMSGVYMIGMIALWYAPETRGQPLPEE